MTGVEPDGSDQVDPSTRWDVIVVGAGNAALCAAISAAEAGASVLVLERAPQPLRGGNSAFTGGAFRVAYAGLDDIQRIVPDLSEADRAASDFGAYPQDAFFDDLARLSRYRMDPDLAEVLVSESLDTVLWMQARGVRFAPIFGRQAFKVGERRIFWGGLTVEVSGGGRGLVETLNRAARRAGVRFLYNARAVDLELSGETIRGVCYRRGGALNRAASRAVVLAAGGFHANAEWRARYLGRNWDLAKVRGSRFNTGDGIEMALRAGAQPFGHWSECHAVAFDMNGVEPGDLEVLNQQKNSFPFGLIVNARGRRFFDEGADFRNYTYSKLGRAILEQPDQLAWQVFDANTSPLLTDEYRGPRMTKVAAESIEDLARAMEGVDPEGFLDEVRAFNASVTVDRPFNPAIRDGRRGLSSGTPKSNWANRLESGPFVAFGVTCGITFTYGGVRTDVSGRVLTPEGRALDGLFAAGEMAAGLYYSNYPGGAGLMSGAVFGRRAGRAAAALQSS